MKNYSFFSIDYILQAELEYLFLVFEEEDIELLEQYLELFSILLLMKIALEDCGSGHRVLQFLYTLSRRMIIAYFIASLMG